jgi:hypothetical protein
MFVNPNQQFNHDKKVPKSMALYKSMHVEYHIKRIALFKIQYIERDCIPYLTGKLVLSVKRLQGEERNFSR